MDRKKIYVADDDLFILEVLKMVLELNDFEVITSCDGISLTQLPHPPDLVFLDIRMSGTNGGEICRNYKNNRQTSHIPVVLISANSDINEIGLASGADNIIAKPFNIKEVVEMAKKYTHVNVETSFNSQQAIQI